MQKNKFFFKTVTAVFAGIMVSGLCACGSISGDGNTAKGGDKKTIYIYQKKVEIDEGLKILTAKYSETHPDVEFKIESTSNDYYTGLKTKFAGGGAPDIFSIDGYADIMTWQGYLTDLTDEPWTQDILDACKDTITLEDGKNYAFPLAIEGSAYMYNKDYFEKAGITELPTTPYELAEAIKKLTDSGVCDYPLIENYNDYYQPANFFLNYGIAAQDDPIALVNALNAGTADLKNNEYFQQMTEFFTLEKELCNNETTTDFNTQTSNFATGKAAITFGGNWAQPTLDDVNPDLNVGLAPVPVFKDAAQNDSIYISSSYWGINKDSESLAEIKDFLTWLATDKEGQEGITKTLQLIPGFSTFHADEESCGVLGMEVAAYVAAGKVRGIYSAYYPNGGLETLGNETCKFIAGKETADEYLNNIETQWLNLAQ